MWSKANKTFFLVFFYLHRSRLYRRFTDLFIKELFVYTSHDLIRPPLPTNIYVIFPNFNKVLGKCSSCTRIHFIYFEFRNFTLARLSILSSEDIYFFSASKNDLEESRVNGSVSLNIIWLLIKLNHSFF